MIYFIPYKQWLDDGYYYVYHCSIVNYDSYFYSNLHFALCLWENSPNMQITLNTTLDIIILLLFFNAYPKPIIKKQ